MASSWRRDNLTAARKRGARVPDPLRQSRRDRPPRAFLQTQHTTDHDTIRNAEALAAQFVYRARNLPDVGLLEFVKITREKTDDSVERFLFIVAAGGDSQIGTATGSERQDAENRLRIGFGTAVDALNVRLL